MQSPNDFRTAELNCGLLSMALEESYCCDLSFESAVIARVLLVHEQSFVRMTRFLWQGRLSLWVAQHSVRKTDALCHVHRRDEHIPLI